MWLARLGGDYIIYYKELGMTGRLYASVSKIDTYLDNQQHGPLRSCNVKNYSVYAEYKYPHRRKNDLMLCSRC